MAEEFELPDFLQNCDVDAIHGKMLAELPDDIDKIQGGFVWDFTRPTATVVSELLEYYIPETLKLIFPQWSNGEYLDCLARTANLQRKAAEYAKVSLVINGEAGIVIPDGTVFVTPATDETESIEFETEEKCILDEGGTGTITARAIVAGSESNVNANTVTLMAIPIDGITSITNPAAGIGGVDEETDDAFRERIIAADAILDVSFVGNNADYKRWAEEVSGVGTAIVIPEWNGPGTVKIVCVDANGEAANLSVLNAVHNHIMSPQDPEKRLAPIGAILTVTAPDAVSVAYKFAVSLEEGYETGMIENVFRTAMVDEYKNAKESGSLKYSHVYSIITRIAGVSDLKELTMNGKRENIKLSKGQYVQTESVNIYTGDSIQEVEGDGEDG